MVGNPAGAFQFDVIQLVVDVFSFAAGVHELGFAQDAQVLRCDGLFDVERTVNFIDARRIFVVDNTADLHTQRVRQGPENIRRRAQVASALKAGSRCGGFFHAWSDYAKIGFFVCPGKDAIYLLNYR